MDLVPDPWAGMMVIGQRVKLWRRRRGMSQRVLAGLSGLSQGHLSKIENGESPLDRKSTLAAVANALDVSVTQLLGEHGGGADPGQERAMSFVPRIRSSIVELGVGDRRTPVRSRDALRKDAAALVERRNASDYAGAAGMLPDLLVDLAAYRGDLAPAMLDALSTARTVLKRLGCIDLARETAQLGVRVAQDHGDPAWLGLATFSWAHSFPMESSALAARITTRAANDIQTLPGRDVREVYGHLHLSAAHSEAVARRPDEARAHLDEAADVARSLGEPERRGPLTAGLNGNWFGPTNVELWRMGVAAEQGDTVSALAISDRIDLSKLPVPNRQVYYWVDLARALAADGRRDREAMHALANAERAAPQHFRLNPVARDLVATLIARTRRRSVAAEMTALARRLGLDPL